MSAEGSEAVTLKQLKMLGDSLTLAGGGSQAQRRFISMVTVSATHTLMKATGL